MRAVRFLKVAAWVLLGVGTAWWLLLMLFVTGYGASGAQWLFLGGLAVLSLPVGVLWLLRAPTVTRVISAGLLTVGIGAGLALWSDLDETVYGSQELGWLVIVVGIVGVVAAATDDTALIGAD